MFYKIQYAIESISSNSRLIRAWVRHLPKVIEYLNNYQTKKSIYRIDIRK